jgi:hypothetical protein
MSRHDSQPKSLNFYPTAPRRWRFGYLTLHTFACCRLRRLGFAHHKQKSAILPTRIIIRFISYRINLKIFEKSKENKLLFN